MQTKRVILTYQDYLELPDDGRRYEIHQGELSVAPAPGTAHQRSSGNLYSVLRQHVKSHHLGELLYAPVDCILDDATIVQPDLIFMPNDRLALISERGIEGPPTLVVEILSRYSIRIDRVRKLQLYAHYGVPYYWIVDNEVRTIEAFRLVDGRYDPAGRVTESEPTSLPPFPDLVIAPESIWY